MGKRITTPLMKEIVERAKRCELCGSTKSLEAHHIIPVCCGGEDCEENLICVCQRCHALLTPRHLLCKIGIQKAKDFDKHQKEKIRLYELIQKHFDESGYCSDSIYDAIEEW